MLSFFGVNKDGDDMLKFFLGMFCGGTIVLVLYACILVSKENEQINKEKISQNKNDRRTS